MGTVIVESCHNTWVFDSTRMRFCRILKGIEVAHRSVSTEWRPYMDLEFSPRDATFTVYLNVRLTRLIRSWRHRRGCLQCSGHETSELSLDDIRHALPLGASGQTDEVRLEIYVRPNASRSAVGGDFDGRLVVHVLEPADAGRATEAALRSVASALDLPRRSVHLLRGATTRRKLLEIDVAPAKTDSLRRTADGLRSGHQS